MVQKVFLYSSSFLLKIAALKSMYRTSPYISPPKYKPMGLYLAGGLIFGDKNYSELGKQIKNSKNLPPSILTISVKSTDQ